ncbi:hypothetical protein Ancab_029317 [Ancistrocladus abbreviatus]
MAMLLASVWERAHWANVNGDNDSCRKRQSASSISPHQENSASNLTEARRTNAALFLEDIKQEVESLDYRGGTPLRIRSAYKRRSLDSHGLPEFDTAIDLGHLGGSYSLKSCKVEQDVSLDAGEMTFPLFASLLDSALQGA